MSSVEPSFAEVSAMLGRMAKKEQDDLDRQMGQFILDVLAANEARRQEEDLLVKAVAESLAQGIDLAQIRADQAKASEAEDKE